MPMPMQVIFINKTKQYRIPPIIRIESKRSLPFSIPPSSLNASFTLFIDYSMDMKSNAYPDLGIDESYQLNITSHHHASLIAKTYVGVIRGLSTFEQLQHQDNIPIPLLIVDKPRFVWRGLLLDVARHFIPISIIKQTIDFMKLVKMNVLHLHLSDDQGFRLQSKRFPRLHDPHEFYSQSEIQTLIEYARQHAVRIIPEFDMPAHTASWFVGYSHLASSDKSSYQLEKTWGVHNATMDVTRQSTYDFLEKFFSEMTQIFSDEFFHIGGDECAPYEWMESEHIQKFMKDKKLDNHQSLQAYFTERIEKILKKFNREYRSLSYLIF
jgi:hexosaminidase